MDALNRSADVRLPSAASLALARTGIELKQFFRERDHLVFTFSFPLILLFIFGSVFSDDIAPGRVLHPVFRGRDDRFGSDA